ncbi:MAG: hypothetical protein QOC66_2172 [Pseudonocardiales bacterium]|jgi:hypothetical protein|nr:hypothetical protein [Pseudonocardiales bacterium]
MYAQLSYFNGPRSDEVVRASERAGKERILPALAAQPEVRANHVATYILRQPDGGELVIAVSETEEALRLSVETILSTELLPGEDPALLSQPDRVEMYSVVHAIGRDFDLIGEPA